MNSPPPWLFNSILDFLKKYSYHGLKIEIEKGVCDHAEEFSV